MRALEACSSRKPKYNRPYQFLQRTIPAAHTSTISCKSRTYATSVLISSKIASCRLRSPGGIPSSAFLSTRLAHDYASQKDKGLVSTRQNKPQTRHVPCQTTGCSTASGPPLASPGCSTSSSPSSSARRCSCSLPCGAVRFQRGPRPSRP